MKSIQFILFSFLFSFQIKAQITVGSSTLPDVGDMLIYTDFIDFPDSTSFKMEGEDLNWTYNDFTVTGTSQENYADIQDSDLMALFPEANMIVNILAFEAAAVKSENKIEVLGLDEGFLGLFGIEANVELDDSYLYKQTPLAYGDSYSDDFDFVITIDAELIPGLDSIEIPLPGATLDSLRFTTNIAKTETVTAWGTLDILGNQMEVLKVEQRDESTTLIEAGLNFFGAIVWLDVSDIAGDLVGDFGTQDNVTHKFLSADSKRSIVEFTENTVTDSLDNNFNVVGGRLSAEILSNADDLQVLESSVSVFPNPTSDFARLNNLEEDVHVFVYGQCGQVFYESQSFNSESIIDLRKMPAGNYFIQLFTDEGNFVKQVTLIK